MFPDALKSYIFSFLEESNDFQSVRLSFRKARFLIRQIRRFEACDQVLTRNMVNFLIGVTNLVHLDFSHSTLSLSVSAEDFCLLSQLNLQFINFPTRPGLPCMFLYKYRLSRAITGRGSHFDFVCDDVDFDQVLEYRNQKLKCNYDIVNQGYKGEEMSRYTADILYFLEVLLIRKITIGLHFGYYVYVALRTYQFPLSLILETDDPDHLEENWEKTIRELRGANIQKLNGRILKSNIDISQGVFSKVKVCNTLIGNVGKLEEAIREMPAARIFKVRFRPSHDKDYRDRIAHLISIYDHIDYLILVSFDYSREYEDSNDILDLLDKLPDWIKKRILISHIDCVDAVPVKEIVSWCSTDPEFPRWWWNGQEISKKQRINNKIE